MDSYCESDRIYLRRVEIDDAALVTVWKQDPYIREMSIGIDAKITVENQEREIMRAIDSPNERYMIIIEKSMKKPIGYIRINWLDEHNQFAWLRFGLGELRGKGYANEAVRLLMAALFEEGAHRVDAEVYRFNEPSYRLLKRIGFKDEGLRREAYFDGVFFHDIIILGLLKGDML